MVLRKLGEDITTPSPGLAVATNANRGLTCNNNNPVDPFLSRTDSEAARYLTASNPDDQQTKKGQESNSELESARFRFPELKESLPKSSATVGKGELGRTVDDTEDLLVHDDDRARNLAATLAQQLRDQQPQQMGPTEGASAVGGSRAGSIGGRQSGLEKSLTGLTPMVTGANNNTSPPPQMLPTLNAADRHFNEFSPHYVPATAHSYSASSDNTTPAQISTHSTGVSTNPFRDSPSRSQTTVHQRQGSASSITFGADLSSFDASSSRAMPGHRGGPTVGMEGWASDIDMDFPVAKTWEEEQQRRRLAGVELMKRKEEAEQAEMERRLGEEFWRGEEEKYGPVMTQPRISQQEDTSNPADVIYSGGAVIVPGDAYYIPVSNPPVIQSATASDSQSMRPAHQVPQPSTTLQQPQAPEQNLAVSQPPTKPPLTQQRDPSAEVYHIKHITWTDPITKQSRRSPILLQNENGPCPLLALVNALILSKHPDVTTSLSETLRVREQISLGLLLDSVFDGVVTKVTSENLDVGDLFNFLLSLRTGMNVNPRFVPPTPAAACSSNSSIPTTSSPVLGTFEGTKEMKLYNSFEIPLHHGWLPKRDHLAYKVLENIAPTYEDAQNLILHEEEILHRISTATQGSNQAELTEEEQVVIKNAAVVREWLESTKTQLTGYGLEMLTKLLGGDGKIGILFRNDHFLTVIRNTLVEGPSGEGKPVLFALVTDMGYSGYEEVVWESLISVSGAGAQFFAGDFRPVGGGGGGKVNHAVRGGQHIRSMLDVGDDDDERWETVASSKRRQGNQNQNVNANTQSPPPLPKREQQSQNQKKGWIQALTGRGSSQGPPSSSQEQYSHIDSNLSANSSSVHFTPESLPPRNSSTRAVPQDTLSSFVPPAPGEDTSDYDLALALQLQEEENEKERQRQVRERGHRNQKIQQPQNQARPYTAQHERANSRSSLSSHPIPSQTSLTGGPPLPASSLPAPLPLPPVGSPPNRNEREPPPPPYENRNNDRSIGRGELRQPPFLNNDVQLTRRRSEVLRFGREGRNLLNEINGNNSTAYQAQAQVQQQQLPGEGAGYPGNVGGTRGRQSSWDYAGPSNPGQGHAYGGYSGYDGDARGGYPGGKREKECVLM